jgi:hypothetical protein
MPLLWITLWKVLASFGVAAGPLGIALNPDTDRRKIFPNQINHLPHMPVVCAPLLTRHFSTFSHACFWG